MYTPVENLMSSHANCMQHVLRCCERQSDGTEYKKILRRPGVRPGPRWGSLQHSRKPLVGGRGWLSPKNLIPRSRPFWPHLSYPQWATGRVMKLAMCKIRVQDYSETVYVKIHISLGLRITKIQYWPTHLPMHFGLLTVPKTGRRFIFVVSIYSIIFIRRKRYSKTKIEARTLTT